MLSTPSMPAMSALPALPALIPGPLAAEEAGVAPATIRKWVQLGHLRAAGKAGRAQLFRLEDVFAAERRARRRTAPTV
ncbi:hypothetical protein [Streptomyces exfoliatus]|uniref:hypothetical protein n=1 Tax=Streptomyces TaxID=1883 RepID=UPI000A6CC81B|nr:hypothetical protein [Streptomyces exfoliatus]